MNDLKYKKEGEESDENTEAKSLNKHEEELTQMRAERDEARKKYSELSSFLRNQVECPVCLEVPTSGPIYVCPNGHFICSQCKEDSCPTCRSRMFRNKSLLAVKVIEKIEHRCKHAECDELIALAELETHMKTCVFRIINCPAPSELCNKKVAFCQVMDHILNECDGSTNKKENCEARDFSQKLPYTLPYHNYSGPPFRKDSMPGVAFLWADEHFYMNRERGEGYAVFSVQFIGDPDDCKNYQVDIGVHRHEDGKGLAGVQIQRAVGEPFPIDMEQANRRRNGLSVGDFVMDKLVARKRGKWFIDLSLNIKSN